MKGEGVRRKVTLCLTLSIFRIDPTYRYLIQSETPDLDRFWGQNKEKLFTFNLLWKEKEEEEKWPSV